MKQNVLGFILFVFIVGTAILISGILTSATTYPKIAEVPVIENHSHCPTVQKRQNNQIKITQAFLNQQNNQLYTRVQVADQSDSDNRFQLTFHFFVKNGTETRYMTSESFAVQGNNPNGQDSVYEFVSSFDWLEKLSRKDNIYVVVSKSIIGFENSQSIPRFDEANATPVLLMQNK